MKVKLLFVFVLVYSQIKAQYSEFKLYDNGLIYSEASMGKLKRIVDSLNLKFKVCDLSKKYYSNRQAIAHHLSLEGKKAKEAKADIEKNISFEDFVKKYPKTKVVEKLLVMTEHYKAYDNSDVLEFYNLELSERNNFRFYFRNKKESEVIHGNWIYEYTEKSEYSTESVEAYYIVKPFESLPLPQKYSKLIQYSDCLIDTTGVVFKKEATRGFEYYNDSIPNKARAFNRYVEAVLKRPDFDNDKFDVIMGMDTIDFERPNKRLSKKDRLAREKKAAIIEKEYELFGQKMEAWETARLTRLDSLKNHDPKFMAMLLDAYAEAKVTSATEDQFEEYVGMYVSKEAELELKRNRRVVGACSMDDSPRRHALSIAMLSAETTKWEIFLQSHLNIMNDRFDRVSDGSYAQQGRSTYIREIEDLDINVLDLLLGISLRVENPAQNHYYGSIGRLGRALSESKNKEAFEEKALTMIEDNELDTFNRLLIYFLFRNYNANLDNEFHQKRNMEKLKTSIGKLPDYVVNQIDLN